MNNEPVAWINREEGSGSILDWEKDPYSETNIPLYTHPVDVVNTSEQYVDKSQNNRHDLGISEAIGFDKGYAAAQAKTLTDEEIGELIGQYSHYENWEGFAKAILRKAQEK
jgi:hypothetical protein